MFRKKALSIFLSLAMSVTMMPMMAFADETADTGNEGAEPAAAEFTAQSDDSEEQVSLLMNIPYEYFYAEEFHGNKNENKGEEAPSAAVYEAASQGNYHEPAYTGENSEGTVKGVTFGVKASKEVFNKLLNTSDGRNAVLVNKEEPRTIEGEEYSGKELLFDCPAYSYYELEDGEELTAYKELTAVSDEGVPTFGKAKGEGVDTDAGELEGEVSYYTENENDVEVTFSGDDLDIESADQIKAVWVRCETPNDHHHCFGLLKGVNVLGPATIGYDVDEIDIKDGDRIDTVEYYYVDSEGNDVVKKFTADIEVLKVINDLKLKVNSNDLASGVTLGRLNQKLPDEFKAEATLLDKNGNPVDEDNYVIDFNNPKVKVTYVGKNLEVGKYTVKLHDTSGEYADITGDFELTASIGEPLPAEYNESAKNPALVATDPQYQQDKFENFVKNIDYVSVDGEESTFEAVDEETAEAIIDDEGKINLEATDAEGNPVFELGKIYDLTVMSNGFERSLHFELDLSYTYALMNLPYDVFYESESAENTADAVTSATQKVWGSLAAGSYHEKRDAANVEETGLATGVIYTVRALPEDMEALLALHPDAVEITDDSEPVTITTAGRGGKTNELTYEGKDILFDSPSYSYYVLGTDETAAYKTVTVDEAEGEPVATFSAAAGEGVAEDALGTVEGTVENNTHHGNDFEITLEATDDITASTTVNAIVVTTDEESDNTYGLVHVTNIWRTLGIGGLQAQLPLGGKTIKAVTFYTADGVYTYDADIFVPEVAYDEEKITATMDDSLVGGTATTGTATGKLSAALPTDFERIGVLKDADGNPIEGTSIQIDTLDISLTYASGLMPGVYNFTITDTKGHYADIETTVNLYTEEIPAEYNEEPAEPALVEAEGATEGYFEAFVKNITAVTVDGTEYATTGRSAVKIIDEEGNIDLEAKDAEGNNIFTAGNSYEVSVASAGFAKALPFTLDLSENFKYVLMNIPYADFYSAEGATFTEPAEGEAGNGTAAGAYVDENGAALGVIFPVKVSDRDLEAFMDGKTDATVADDESALSNSASYSYYVLSNEEKPAVFKLLSFEDDEAVFGEIKGDGVNTESQGTLDAEIAYSSAADEPDFTIALGAADEDTVFGFDADSEVSAIIFDTDRGDRIGLLHVTNLVDAVTIAGTHAQLPLDGSTVNKVTYITTDGVYVYDANFYVEAIPQSDLVDSKVTVDIDDPAVLESGSTEAELSGYLTPINFQAAGSVQDLTDAVVTLHDGKKVTIAYSTDAVPGPYTLVLKDNGAYYANIEGDFIVQTDTEDLPAEFNQSQKAPALVQSEAAKSEAHFLGYLKNIDSVTVTPVDPAGEAKEFTGEDTALVIDANGNIIIDSEAAEDEIVTEDEGDGDEGDGTEPEETPVFERGNVYEVTVSSVGYTHDLTFTLDLRTFVLMNIPYEGFYFEEADTVAKPFEAATADAIKDYSKLAGTFHDGDSGIIEGIVFPVLVDPDTDLDGLTVAESEEELFGLPAYSYYELDVIPDCYKIIYYSDEIGYYFDWAEGPETVIDGEAELLTETAYGDFQLNLKDLDPALFGYDSLDEVPACGVLIRTVDESSEYAYSLTHVQNVLSLSELAWSVGLTTEVDGAAIDAESYADLNGETINAVWFITREGRVKVNFEGIYVPIKLPADQASVKVANATTAAGTTTVTTVLPDGFEAEFSVEGLTGATVNEAGTALTYPTSTAAGTYKLTVEDKSGVYAPLTAEFTLTTSGGGGGTGGGGGGGGGGGRTTPTTPAVTPIPEPEVPLAETPELTFTDVPANAWFANAVKFVVENGYMKGISDTLFGPEITTDRGMIVTILYRMAGSPAVTTAAPYGDVKAGMYYTDAVAWGSANGIVKGYTDGTFKPSKTITREELAAMLYRYEQFNGGGFTGSWYFPLTASDADSISEYADEAIHWCVMNGLISGFEDGTLRPQGDATRAQVAAIIQRFVSLSATQPATEEETTPPAEEETENTEGAQATEGTQEGEASAEA
ncbi:MAG: S-layer homology domain-containing protein [Clostridia bacterium]|nr:S-layer homology domain-containing protein [Clostridia bacterium]